MMTMTSDNFVAFTIGKHPLLCEPMPGFDDGHYSMMDWGQFVVKDKLAYFPDGDVYDTRISQPARWYPPNPRIEACREDYSAWDDDRRCLEQAIRQAERDAEEDARIEYYATRDALVEQAKAKLTTEEFEAVLAVGRDDQ